MRQTFSPLTCPLASDRPPVYHERAFATDRPRPGPAGPVTQASEVFDGFVALPLMGQNRRTHSGAAAAPMRMA